MKIGDIWTDIDGKKYEVVDVNVINREDGSVIKNVTSKPVST